MLIEEIVNEISTFLISFLSFFKEIFDKVSQQIYELLRVRASLFLGLIVCDLDEGGEFVSVASGR